MATGSPPDMFSWRKDLVAVGPPLAVDKLAEVGEVFLPELWLQSGEPRLEHFEADCYKPILIAKCQIKRLIGDCRVEELEVVQATSRVTVHQCAMTLSALDRQQLVDSSEVEPTR